MHLLLEDRELTGVPILVCGNKVDVKPHLSESDIIEGLNLDYIKDNSWVVLMISALKGTNLSEVLNWMIKKSKR